MAKRIALFWPGDARTKPNELAMPSIRGATEQLEQFPRSGRVVAETARQEIREIIVHGYRVIYRLSSDEVEILTVHHGARLLGDIGRP